jgi:hypothetical protein
MPCSNKPDQWWFLLFSPLFSTSVVGSAERGVFTAVGSEAQRQALADASFVLQVLVLPFLFLATMMVDDITRN